MVSACPSAFFFVVWAAFRFSRHDISSYRSRYSNGLSPFHLEFFTLRALGIRSLPHFVDGSSFMTWSGWLELADPTSTLLQLVVVVPTYSTACFAPSVGYGMNNDATFFYLGFHVRVPSGRVGFSSSRFVNGFLHLIFLSWSRLS